MRRKKSRPTPPPAPQRPREEPFHSPFRDMQEQLRAVGQARPATSPSAVPAVPPPPPTRSPEALMQREKAVFLAEMAGVTPLPKDSRGRIEKPPSLLSQPLYAIDEYDALADLRDLVEGRGEFTIQYTDEYMEGLARGSTDVWRSACIVAIMRCRRISTCMAIPWKKRKSWWDRFLTSAYAAGQRCILLIHGRGLNSKDNKPVLKEQVRIWLSHGRLSRLVLAFAHGTTHEWRCRGGLCAITPGPGLPEKIEGVTCRSGIGVY